MNGDSDESVSRRSLLKAGAGSALGGLFVSDTVSAAVEGKKVSQQNIYSQFGVRPIINAAGTITTLGGSLMPVDVMTAWTEASKHFVDLRELQERVGEKIAELLGVEAALVTTGAAGGITIATAAAITYRDKSLIDRLPLPPEMGIEVVRQKAHRDCYDNQVQACGVRLVDVETLDELESVINTHTAMMFSYNFLEGESTIAQPDWIKTARRNNVPTLLDAAADTPPLDALSRYNEMGFDMVVFSGGKAIQGPQDAGLLLGRKDLIEAARLNASPNCGNIGRGMKVSKEDMVAMWAAVKRFVELDHESQWQEWERRVRSIAHSVSDIPSVKTKQIVPAIANNVPHLLISWDESLVKLSPSQMKSKLAEGDPAIATARIHGTGDDGFLVSVFMLKPGEEEFVGARIREVLKSALTN